MLRIVIAVLASLISSGVLAHHVLGRPAYSLGEDSNTPPSMQVETQIGKYYVTYMVFPAFPEPGKQGRVNLYATRIDNGEPYKGKITFLIKDDKWFGGHEEQLGVQEIDDGVYRQGFLVNEAGNYLVRARFFSEGEPYIIDFPLKVGKSSVIGPIGITITAILVMLVGVNMLQRKRLLRSRIRQASQADQS
jgi:hypothetical protein